MESTPKCSTATTSVAWRREAEAGTPPQAADSRRVRDGDGDGDGHTAVVVVDHELRPADWCSAERGDDGGCAQSGGVA